MRVGQAIVPGTGQRAERRRGKQKETSFKTIRMLITEKMNFDVAKVDKRVKVSW
jgi:hypothetical protein